MTKKIKHEKEEVEEPVVVAERGVWTPDQATPEPEKVVEVNALEQNRKNFRLKREGV